MDLDSSSTEFPIELPTPEDWIAVLNSFPQGLNGVKDYVSSELGIQFNFSSTDLNEHLKFPNKRVGKAWDIWYAIDDHHSDDVNGFMSKLVLSLGGLRIASICRKYVEGAHCEVKVHDSILVQTLFLSDDMGLPPAGNAVLDFWEANNAYEEVDSDYLSTSRFLWEDLEFNGDEMRVESNSEFDHSAFIDPYLRASSTHSSGWTLQPVGVDQTSDLVIPTSWSTTDLEGFLFAKWELIRFKDYDPLFLAAYNAPVGRSSPTFVARAAGGFWIPVFTAVHEASKADLDKLVSSIVDFEKAGKNKNQVKGILIAPSFSQEVVKQAAESTNISLLVFSKGA